MGDDVSGEGRVGDKGPLPCLVCQRDVLHEVIAPVSHGDVYVRCCACGTVRHAKRGG